MLSEGDARTRGSSSEYNQGEQEIRVKNLDFPKRVKLN